MAFDKNKYKSVIESGYKTVLGFYEAMRYLYSVVNDKKVQAAKDAIKILKHHEKTKTLKLPLASIYYYFSLFYTVIGDLDSTVEYEIKTNEQYYTNEPDETKKNEYLLKIATGYLSLSLKNYKIKDKKLLLQSIDCFDKYLNNTKKPANLHYFKNLHNILEEVYSSDTYKVKSYAKAKILSNLFDKKYFDLFTKEDFEFYLDYLKRTNLIFNKENHYNYTLGLYSYKFNSTDYENHCRYATFLTRTNEYEHYNEKKALSIFENCLTAGYHKSIINIVDFYLYKQDFKELITRINNFLKRKSIDDEIILTIADRLFNAAIKDNKVKLRYEKVAEKAATIYIKYEKKLNKERKGNLALIYTYGLGVDINLDKAKEFAVDENITQQIEQSLNKELVKQIKIKDKKYKEECEKLIEGFLKEDLFLIYTLCYEIYFGEKFEENQELYFNIASKYYEKDKHFAYILALYYFSIDKEKYNKYLNEALAIDNEDAVKRRGLDLYDECIKKGDLTEFNEFIELKKQNKNLELVIKRILAISYTKDYSPKHLKEKGLELCLEINKIDDSMNYTLACIYFHGKIVSTDLDKAYHFAKKHLDLHEDPFAYDLIYRINKTANYKFFDKEKSAIYLEKSLLEDEIFSSSYHEAFMLFSSSDLSKPDYKKAFKYLKISADFKFLPAIYNLGYIYLNGSSKYNVDVDLDKAYELIKPCYKEKYKDSGVLLGCLYSNEKFKYYDPKKGVSYFEEAYKSNKTSAAYFLGIAHKHGKGAELDLEKAYKYLQESSNNGFAAAKCQLSRAYYSGFYLVDSPDYETSYKLSKELIDDGYNDETNFFYAVKSLQYLGRDKEAINLINETLKKYPDSSILHYFLGNAYKEGAYVKEDIDKAVKEYHKSISLGGYIAYNSLFYLYFDNNSLYQDLSKADQIINEGFKKYPEQLIFAYCNNLFSNEKYKEIIEVIDKYNAHEECAEFLGALYYGGLGVQQDYKKAFILYNRAFKHSPNSQSLMYKLGCCYFFGQGVAEDKALAKELMYKAILGKYKEAEIFWKEWIEK